MAAPAANHHKRRPLALLVLLAAIAAAPSVAQAAYQTQCFPTPAVCGPDAKPTAPVESTYAFFLP
jgi:hypothetical protein